MKASLFGLFCAAAVVLPACQKDDQSIEKALASIDKRLDTIEGKLADGVPTRAGAAAAGAAPARAPQARPPGPDPTAVYAVPVDSAPSVGPADAKITIVKAFEFACPFCTRVRPTLDQLMADYKGEVRIVYKHLLIHPGVAATPAYASCAAHMQGKFKPMYDLIWSKGFEANRNLSRDKMVALADELKLDMRKFEADMDGEACKQRVAQDQQELQRVGARGTPAFFINGRYLSGAQPIENFKAIVDDELAKTNARVGKGASPATYYRDWVLQKGKKVI
jgi:protein-disulfide isomerase